MIIPLVDDRRFLQDQLNKISDIGRVRVIQILKHLPFRYKGEGVSMVKVAADEHKCGVFRGSACKSLHRPG